MLLSNKNDTVLVSYNVLPIDFLKAIQAIATDSKIPVIMTPITEPFTNIMSFNQKFESSWIGLQQVFRHILSESILNNQFAGSNVCGVSDGLVVDEELCLRWYVEPSLH